jgi:hypothetical protein
MERGIQGYTLGRPTCHTQSDALSLMASRGGDYLYSLVPELAALSGTGFFQTMDLERQVLLHLPRFSFRGSLGTVQVQQEIRRLAVKLAERRRHAPAEIKSQLLNKLDLRRAHLDSVDPDLALATHRVFHYLGSTRREGIHLGLYGEASSGKRPLLSVVTLSPFDLRHIKDALPFGIHAEESLVLSRLFAFPSAPFNAVSFTLGRVFEWLQTHMPNIRALLTYLNPNLGFRGTVLKATNWKLLGEEAKKCYLYIDGDYKTDRYAIREYGTADPITLAVTLGPRFSTSAEPLLPLKVFIYLMDSSLRRASPEAFGYNFTPDNRLVGGVAR